MEYSYGCIIIYKGTLTPSGEREKERERDDILNIYIIHGDKRIIGAENGGAKKKERIAWNSHVCISSFNISKSLYRCTR
jgi:hypothetical protein